MVELRAHARNGRNFGERDDEEKEEVCKIQKTKSDDEIESAAAGNVLRPPLRNWIVVRCLLSID